MFKMNWFRRRRLHKEYERESFNASLEMQQDAQKDLDARLRIAEIRLKNELRTR